MSEVRLGEILQREHGLGDAQLEEGLRAQAREGRRIGSMLMALGYSAPDDVANALARQKGVPAARLKHFDNVDPRTLELVPKHVAEVHRAIPLGIAKRERKELIVAMRDPDNQAALDEIGFFSGMPVRAAVAPELIIDQYLARLYGVIPARTAGRNAAPLEPEAPARREPAWAGPPDLGVVGAPVASANGPPGEAAFGPPDLDTAEPLELAAAVSSDRVTVEPLDLESVEPEPSIDLDDVTPEPVGAPPIDLGVAAKPVRADSAVATPAPREAARAPTPARIPERPAAGPGAHEGLMGLVRPWLPLVLLVAGSAAFVLMARNVKRAKVGGKAPVEVDGTFYCGHVGATIEFPYGEGWTYLPAENQTQSVYGFEARAAYFYKGGSAEQPDDALALTVLDSGGQLSARIDENEFQRLLQGFKGGVRDQGPVQMRMYECQVTGARGPLSGECTGGATYQGMERHLIAFVWIDPGGILVVAAFISLDPVEEQLDAIDALVGSIALD